MVNDLSDSRQQGAVIVKVNLDNDKLTLNEGKAITVVDSALSITASQITDLIPANKIEGGLSANNINITYSYMEGDVEHADGKKSVQEFYDETDAKIKDIEAATKAETLERPEVRLLNYKTLWYDIRSVWHWLNCLRHIHVILYRTI